MKLSDYLFLFPIITACAGWVVGIFSTYFVTGWLERRRAFRALASELESIRSEFDDFARYEEIHARSVESLKPLVFAALPFLKGQEQKDAREAWAGFRDAKMGAHPKHSMVTVAADLAGEPKFTQQRALASCLDRLQGFFLVCP